MSSPFTGTVQSKLIDPQLNDFGTQVNPIYIKFAVGNLYNIQSITSNVNTVGNKVVIPGIVGWTINVFALSFFTSSGTDCIANFTDGLGGSNLFSILVNASNQDGEQFSEAVSMPSFLFATNAGNDLAVNLSSSINAVANISYFTQPVQLMPVGTENASSK